MNMFLHIKDKILEDNENKEKVEIKFENGEWVLKVINV